MSTNKYIDVIKGMFTPEGTILNGKVKINGVDFCIPLFSISGRDSISDIYNATGNILPTYFAKVSELISEGNVQDVDLINNFLYFTDCNDKIQLNDDLTITDRRMLLPYNLNLLLRKDLAHGIDLFKVNEILVKYGLPNFPVDTEIGGVSFDGWKTLYEDYKLIANKSLKEQLAKFKSDDDIVDLASEIEDSGNNFNSDDSEASGNLMSSMIGSDDEGDITFVGSYDELLTALLPLCSDYFRENDIDRNQYGSPIEIVYKDILANGLTDDKYRIIVNLCNALNEISDLVREELQNNYDMDMEFSLILKANLVDTILEMENLLTEIDLVEMYEICNIDLNLLYNEDFVEYKMAENINKAKIIKEKLSSIPQDNPQYAIGMEFIQSTEYVYNILSSMKKVRKDVEENFNYYTGYLAPTLTPLYVLNDGKVGIEYPSYLSSDRVGIKVDFDIISGPELSTIFLTEKAKLQLKEDKLEYESSKKYLEQLIAQNSLATMYDKISSRDYRVPIVDHVSDYKNFPETEFGREQLDSTPGIQEVDAYNRLKDFARKYCNQYIDELERTTGNNYSFEEATKILADSGKLPKELIMYLAVLFYYFLLQNHYESVRLAKPPIFKFKDTNGMERVVSYIDLDDNNELLNISNSLDYESTVIQNRSKIGADKIYSYFTNLFQKDATDLLDLIIQASRCGCFKSSVFKTQSGFLFDVNTMSEIGTDYLVEENRKEALKEVQEREENRKLELIQKIKSGEEKRCVITSIAIVKCEPGNINDFNAGLLYGIGKEVNDSIPIYLKYYDKLEDKECFSDIFAFGRMGYTYELNVTSPDFIGKRMFEPSNEIYGDAEYLVDLTNPYLEYFKNPEFSLKERNADFLEQLRGDISISIKNKFVDTNRVMPYTKDYYGLKMSCLAIKLLMEANPDYNAKLNIQMWFDNIMSLIHNDEYYTFYDLEDDKKEWVQKYKSLFTDNDSEPSVTEEQQEEIVDVEYEEEKPHEYEAQTINAVNFDEPRKEEPVEEDDVVDAESVEEDDVVDAMVDMPTLEDVEDESSEIVKEAPELTIDENVKQESPDDYKYEKDEDEKISSHVDMSAFTEQPKEEEPKKEKVEVATEEEKNNFLNRANEAIRTQNQREKELLEQIEKLKTENQSYNEKVRELENKNTALKNAMSSRGGNSDLERSVLQLRRELSDKDNLLREKESIIQSLKENKYENMSNEELISSSLFVQPPTNYNERRELFKDEIVIPRNKVQVVSLIRNNFSPTREVIGIFLMVIDSETNRQDCHLMVGKNLNSYISFSETSDGIERLRIKPCCGITSDRIDSEGYAFTILQNNPRVKRIRVNGTSSILNFYTRLEALLEEHFRDPSNEEVIRNLQLVTTVGRDNLKAVAKDYKKNLDRIEKEYLLKLEENKETL